MNDQPQSRNDSQTPIEAMAIRSASAATTLHAESILIKAFEFASENVRQSYEARESTINLYLLLVGGLGASLGTILQFNSGNRNLSLPAIAIVLFAASILSATLFGRYMARRKMYFESLISANLIVEYYLHNLRTAMPHLEDAFSKRLVNIPLTQRFILIGFIVSYPMALGGSLCFSVSAFITTNLMFATQAPAELHLIPQNTLAWGIALQVVS